MIARVSLLLPVDGADRERACQLADLGASTTEPKRAVAPARFCEALAEYRRDHFNSAIEWTDRSISSCTLECNAPTRAGDYSIQACAYARSGQLVAARAALTKGNEFSQQARQHVSGDFGADWADWTIADLLRREAAQLLAEKAASDAKSGKRD